jgi:tRNA-splicing ligase RtcB
MSYDVLPFPSGGLPIKAWTRGLEVEAQALEQLRNVATLPFLFRHVAVMPDVHWGNGAAVGSVIPTKGAVIPAAVGVDLGCGMMAAPTNLRASDLPDNLAGVRAAIEAAIPHGRTKNGGIGDKGAWFDVPDDVMGAWDPLREGFMAIIAKHPKVERANTVPHLGTLGTGNHFIEVCLDETDAVWVMLHSGSRGVGNRIGSYFIEKAKEDMRRWFVNLPDENLAYLPEGSAFFGDYVRAVSWAQDFARINREVMMDRALLAIANALGRAVEVANSAVVQCHHNYISKENHFGENVWVTRKGAVRARLGDLGIIPGSMGARSFIVRGKGNADSFHSCSHGAGRRMSRGAARKAITLEDHAKATAGIECRKDADVIDESPAAYKNIEAVLEAQRDLVEVVHALRQVVNVKG